MYIIINYFLRPEKKGAFNFKNLKLKKYFSNQFKLNWINSSNLFLIRLKLVCSSKYYSFWEIKVLKIVNKLCFGQKMEKVGKFVYFYIKSYFLRALQIWGKNLAWFFPLKDIEIIAFSQNTSILKKFVILMHLFFRVGGSTKKEMGVFFKIGGSILI